MSNSPRLIQSDIKTASEEWNFNCGPAAICAITNKTPAEIRPDLLDFEAKGYTNPSLMFGILNRLGIQYKSIYRSDNDSGTIKIDRGLVRIQWGGPWTRPNVPLRARYRCTHWIAVDRGQIFDINAMVVGGWIDYDVWSKSLVPWLIETCYPKADGTWWPTHQLEIKL